MINDFNQLNLQPELVRAVIERGYTSPTPIQSQVIPVLLAGQDVIGQAKTGTGKTAAFALPVLQNLVHGTNIVQCLVVTPTRELASQVAQAFVEYGRYRTVRVLAVYGGQPYGHQIHRLKEGVDVLVGTPGRLLDLLERKVLNLSDTQTVILDEADEMLSMGFEEDIDKILRNTNETRQTALFSATIPPTIRTLAKKYMGEPQSITIEDSKRTVGSIDQRYYLVNEADKLAALTRLFEMESMTSVLIFTKTRSGSDELANQLSGQGYPAEALNGDLSQDARERVLNRFKRDQINVLVATDIAARGLDIDNISHVINFDLPFDVESYVHRIGRTGRAGKAGTAISLITPAEQWRLGRIEKYIRHPITRAEIPTKHQIIQQREDVLIEQVHIWLKRNRCRREQEIVNELVEAGNDPQMIAAVALKLARSEEKQRPIAEISEVQLKSKRDIRHQKVRNSSSRNKGKTRTGNVNSKISHEPGMVRLSMNTGKTQGVRPGDIVGAIASRANIPGYAIGKIFIKDNHTIVDVPEAYAVGVLEKTGTYAVRKSSNVTIERV